MTNEGLEALREIEAHAEDSGDGGWFEALVRTHGPAIRQWRVDAVHPWDQWPERTTVFPDSSPQDIAIDFVAEDVAGERLIAIQSKARRQGSAIRLTDVEGFLSAVEAPEFKEAWIIGTTGPSEELREHLNNRGLTKVRCLRLQDELLQSAQATDDADPDPRDEIQHRVIEAALEGLKNVRGRTHKGWRATDARGRIVMPCGTGKTRVGYRIARELTTPGKMPGGTDRLTIVLCPSIGLVRQLKTAYEVMAESDGVAIETLAVCSDRTGDSARRRKPNVDEAIADDPTADLSGIDGSEITGAVRRKAQDIADWIKERDGDPAAWPVIVSTYQSGPTLAEGVRHARSDAAVLICDEAHRTAGLKKTPKANEATLRNFTVCHDNALLPARNRVYMTATPKTFTRGTAEAHDEGYVVVSMNDEATFGPNLAEVSYREAVEQEALTDYRIAAIVPHNESYEFADERARKHARDAKKKNAEGASSTKSGDRSTSILVRQIAYGTALAAGIDEGDGERKLPVPSSIAFCNRTRTSREMAEELNDPAVRKHIAGVTGQGPDGPAKRYEVHHRDAKSRAGARHTALTKLAGADPENPVGISNVGIFGEGIDTPDLAAIAFIEPRKGPIDVIQAVGRVMRRSKAKNIGLILVPLEIPPDEDAEAWLESRTSENQFKELGQILQALRAHDARIEDRLQHLLRIYEPTGNGRAEKTGYHLLTAREPEGVKTYVAVGQDGVIENALAEADRKKTVAQLLERAADRVREVTNTYGEESLPEKPRSTWVADCRRRSKPKVAPVDVSAAWERRESDDRYPVAPIAEAQRTLLSGAIVDKRKGRNKNTVFLRAPVRREPARPGGGKTPASHGLLGCILENNERGRSIRMRILRNSGLKTESERHMDVLYSTVERAAGKLKADNLEEQLAALLKMDRTTAVKGEQGNACMVAALVLTVAVLVQTRLEAGKGLHNIDVEPLSEIGTSPRPAENLERAFNRILQHDYEPVFTIARDILCDVTRAGRKTAMLDAAVAGIIEQSRDAAEQYATAGADYAGELFNRIMHDRASDGAYFTRPEAGALLAGLALHATDETNFTKGNIVSRLRALDPTCGSGTLLQAWLTAIKRKARDNGATDAVLTRMHRRIVEDALTGLDVNPVSIQLAGAMLMIGDTRVQYARMALRTMPYGPRKERRTAAAGSLELLRQPDVLAHQGGKTATGQDDFFDDELDSFAPREATERALKARVVLTNPPFVTREKLGAKFGTEGQRAIRERIDKSQEELENKLPEYTGFSEKSTTAPLYLALALLAMNPKNGVLGTAIPTVGLLVPSGRTERRKLASELHIRYVVTCHEPGQENLSQSFRADPVNESLVVGTRIGRNDGLATTFVSLDRFPRSVAEAHALADAIAGDRNIDGQSCQVSNERMRNGDWSAAGWRNLKLDEATQLIDRHPMLKRMGDVPGVTMKAPGDGAFTPSPGADRRDTAPTRRLPNEDVDILVYQSKAEDAHLTMATTPDTAAKIKKIPASVTGAERIAAAEKAHAQWSNVRGRLLVSAGQRVNTGRLAAIVDTTADGGLGTNWKPIQGTDDRTARAWAVWLNSTLGRIAMLRNRGKTLTFPVYRPSGMTTTRCPDPGETEAIEALNAAYELTKNEQAPQYRDGRCAVRDTWDEAVAEALGIDVETIFEYAELLAREPAVSPAGWTRTLTELEGEKHS